MTDESQWTKETAATAARVERSRVPDEFQADGMGWPIEERREAEALQRGTLPAQSTCQHYWLQYMVAGDIYATEDLYGGREVYPAGLKPDGYFCVHCPARSDERRVITNPEAL